jgi:hypothetical protein
LHLKLYIMAISATVPLNSNPELLTVTTVNSGLSDAMRRVPERAIESIPEIWIEVCGKLLYLKFPPSITAAESGLGKVGQGQLGRTGELA